MRLLLLVLCAHAWVQPTPIVRKHCITAVCSTKYPWLAPLDDDKPGRVESEAFEQLAFADRVLLNNLDLVPDDAELRNIEERTRTIPQVPIERSPDSSVDWNTFDIKRALDFNSEFLTDLDADNEPEPTFASVSRKSWQRWGVRAQEIAVAVAITLVVENYIIHANGL